MCLPIMEFMRRFLQHVLPRSMKVRYFGFLSPSCALPLAEVKARIKWRTVLPSRPRQSSSNRPRRCAARTVANRYGSCARWPRPGSIVRPPRPASL